eukprot:scaffold16085_cov73-Skeletonema_dohrnii-CCMP3373.AAC.1
MSTMNSPELSLDMNLDSPSASDVVADESGSGSGDGMNCGENNASIVGITHDTHYQQHEKYHNSSNHGHDGADANHYSSFGSGGGGADIGDTPFSSDKIDCDKMTKLIEEWKDELSMMRVKNAILLDDLVKVGANNV